MMFGKIIYGVSKRYIDTAEFYVKCPACQTHQYCDAIISSDYYHFYWLPIVPVGKEVYSICSNCGLKRTLPFDKDFIANNNIEDYKRFRHPVISYLGVIIAIAIFLLFGGASL